MQLSELYRYRITDVRTDGHTEYSAHENFSVFQSFVINMAVSILQDVLYLRGSLERCVAR